MSKSAFRQVPLIKYNSNTFLFESTESELHSDSKSMPQTPKTPKTSLYPMSSFNQNNTERYYEKYNERYHERYNEKFNERYNDKYNEKYFEKQKERMKYQTPYNMNYKENDNYNQMNQNPNLIQKQRMIKSDREKEEKQKQMKTKDKDLKEIKNYQQEMLEAKRNSKNRDAAQQSFLIGLISLLGYDIEINKLYKKGKTTNQLFTINSIKKNETTIFKTYDVVPEVADLRDKRRCLDAVTNAKLLNILSQYEWISITEKKCRLSKYGNSIGMRRLKSITIGKSTLKMKDICEIGKNVHQFITSTMGEKCCVVSSQSFEIIAIFRNVNMYLLEEFQNIDY